jgi:hypothetical protein
MTPSEVLQLLANWQRERDTWAAYDLQIEVQRLLPCQGNPIQSEVVSFYNLYNPEDKFYLYWLYEVAFLGDKALGRTGAQNGIPLSLNYEQYSITDELPKPDEHVRLMDEIKDFRFIISAR